MTLKRIIYLLLFSSLLACQPSQSKNIPVTSLEIAEDTSTLSMLSDYQDFENILAKEKGNIVLVNLWATWCKPCVYEMPLLEKLHKNYEDKGIKVVALSMDEVSKADSLVVPYWEEMKYTMDNYLIATKDAGTFVNKIDPLWIGLLPTSFIFDADGRKVESITGSLSYNGFEKKVLKVLNKVN